MIKKGTGLIRHNATQTVPFPLYNYKLSPKSALNLATNSFYQSQVVDNSPNKKET